MIKVSHAGRLSLQLRRGVYLADAILLLLTQLYKLLATLLKLILKANFLHQKGEYLELKKLAAGVVGTLTGNGKKTFEMLFSQFQSKW